MKTASQPPLVEVARSEAAREADRWTELNADIENKKDLLHKQSELVLEKMVKSGQRVMSITDGMGYKHVFTVIETSKKLRHSKREEE